MTVVHLVRHAPVDGAFDGVCFGQRVDPPIAPVSLADVDRVRAALPAEPKLVVCSPARRAVETADVLGLTVSRVDARWAERDFGTWEGRRWDACWDGVSAQHLRSAEAYLAYNPDGAELFAAVVTRVADALDELRRNGSAAVVITHAGPIRAALVTLAGVAEADVITVEIGHLSVASLSLASVGAGVERC